MLIMHLYSLVFLGYTIHAWLFVCLMKKMDVEVFGCVFISVDARWIHEHQVHKCFVLVSLLCLWMLGTFKIIVFLLVCVKIIRWTMYLVRWIKLNACMFEYTQESSLLGCK